MARRAQFAKGKWSDARSINTIVTDYKNFVGVVEAESLRIMQDAAELTLEATLPHVPVETGALKESGKATAVRTAKGVAALVTFGGADNPVSPTVNAPDGIVYYAPVVNYGGSDKNFATGSDMFLEKGSIESKERVDAYIRNELRKIKP